MRTTKLIAEELEPRLVTDSAPLVPTPSLAPAVVHHGPHWVSVRDYWPFPFSLPVKGGTLYTAPGKETVYVIQPSDWILPPSQADLATIDVWNTTPSWRQGRLMIYLGFPDPTTLPKG